MIEHRLMDVFGIIEEKPNGSWSRFDCGCCLSWLRWYRKSIAAAILIYRYLIDFRALPWLLTGEYLSTRIPVCWRGPIPPWDSWEILETLGRTRSWQ